MKHSSNGVKFDHKIMLFEVCWGPRIGKIIEMEKLA